MKSAYQINAVHQMVNGPALVTTLAMYVQRFVCMYSICGRDYVHTIVLTQYYNTNTTQYKYLIDDATSSCLLLYMWSG